MTDVVRQLTGQSAEDFETTASRYAALPFAQQTFANRIKALAMFNVLPFYPGFNLKAYGREMRFPVQSSATLAAHDPRWQAEHQHQLEQQAGTPPRRMSSATTPSAVSPT